MRFEASGPNPGADLFIEVPRGAKDLPLRDRKARVRMEGTMRGSLFSILRIGVVVAVCGMFTGRVAAQEDFRDIMVSDDLQLLGSLTGEGWCLQNSVGMTSSEQIANWSLAPFSDVQIEEW